MRYPFVILCLLLLSSCFGPESILRIAPNETVEFDVASNQLYEARLKNRSSSEVEVAVLDKRSDEMVRGFGLGRSGEADVIVEGNSKLALRNPGEKDAKILVRTRVMDAIRIDDKSDRVSFTLRNETARSIPLIIPGVMNPNLSPFSNSGVDLEYGQEILFRQNAKRHVLLVVGPEISAGEVIKVGALLQKRRTELGLD